MQIRNSSRNKKFFRPLIASTLAFSLACSFMNAADTIYNEVIPANKSITFQFTDTNRSGNAGYEESTAGNPIVVSVFSKIDNLIVNDYYSAIKIGGNAITFDFNGKASTAPKTFTLNLNQGFIGNIRIINTTNYGDASSSESGVTGSRDLSTKGTFIGTFNRALTGDIFIDDQGSNTFYLYQNVNSVRNSKSIVLGQHALGITTFKNAAGISGPLVNIYANAYGYKSPSNSLGNPSQTPPVVVFDGGIDAGHAGWAEGVNSSANGLILNGNIGGVHENGNPNIEVFTANFINGAAMRGDIITRDEFSTNHVTFGGFGVSQSSFSPNTALRNVVWLEGNIISYGIGGTTTAGNFSQKQGGNIVAFQTGTMKGNIEARHLSNASPGYNQVQFLQDGVVYEGNITASGGENVLFFGSQKKATVNGIPTANAIKTAGNNGSPTPSSNGASGQQSAQTKIVTTGNNATFKGNLLAENGGKNTVTFYKNGKIGGTRDNPVTITANNGENFISFKNGGLITNTTVVAQEEGKNSINFSTSDRVNNKILLAADISTNEATSIATFSDSTPNNNALNQGARMDAMLDGIAFAGNFIVSGGYSRAVFSNAYWAPSNIKKMMIKAGVVKDDGNGAYALSAQVSKNSAMDAKIQALYQYVFTENKSSGNIIATNGGIGLVVLGGSRTNPLQFENIPIPEFNVVVSDESNATILLQTPMTLDANITYGGHFAGNSYVYDGSNNTVTLFFANKRSEGTTAPSTTPSNNASQTRAASQVSNTSPVNNTSSTTELAASFKDGISLQLQDKSINLDGKDGTYSTSFISTAMSHGLGANSTTPLHVHVIKSGDANSGYKDAITLSGIAVGSVSALSSSDATNPAAINSTYTINLQNKSIFLGSFSKDLQNSHTKVNLVLEHNAKFIADSSTQLENLTIQAATFDKNDSATPTLLQNNTVVDVASGGGSNNITREGNTFYLLSIGKDPQI
ncbi:outer membrane autotransporter [Helicobacter mustelae]|uniref:hypothetical protein n=1 Tax=Helicobacter mustelae TaxID=217 RepID=UPI000DFDCF0A|nr:hypothetical protein [Helicobacter mustelae]STP11965.1 outer membrane autotransporter [Helicobacter mustelae]